VALRATGRGIEHLVEVREAQLPAADLDRGGARGGRLAHDLRGLLVVAQALVGGRAQHARARPLTELDLGDQARLGEDRLARGVRPGGVERRGLALERGEQAAQAVELGPGETGADATGEPQRTVLPDSHEQRADAVAAPSLPRQPAADHELLALDVLDLHPVGAAPPGLVRAVQSLRDDALEALRLAGGEHLLAVADDVVGRLPALAV